MFFYIVNFGEGGGSIQCYTISVRDLSEEKQYIEFESHAPTPDMIKLNLTITLSRSLNEGDVIDLLKMKTLFIL